MSVPKLSLPKPLAGAVGDHLQRWRAIEGTRRLWEQDKDLWTCEDEDRWLGWLDIATGMVPTLPSLRHFADDIAREGFTDVAVLGMGGSSLCPFVFSTTFPKIAGRPALHVLDSTDPQQIRSLEAKLDLERTLVIVSSKSGSTLEPNILLDYFLDRVKQPKHFVAITDPGSQLEQKAMADGFRVIFPGVPEIGGRFSALSNFGIVPAALAGIDLHELFVATEHMMLACHQEDPGLNPGVLLGIVMAEAAARGMDKLTIFASEGISEIGAWLEQLIAESTGKLGKGIIPVPGEAVHDPHAYGDDRLFVHLHLEGHDDPQDAPLARLEQAGKPVVRLPVASKLALGAEFFRWEFATAVAGSLMRINPFNQPDVEAAKVAARKLTDVVEKGGTLPSEEPFHSEQGIKLFGKPPKNVTQITLPGILREHLGQMKPHDYGAVLAYVEMNDANVAPLLSIRERIGRGGRFASTLGFGPRYLHSTGQLHKGGPNSGVFVQVTGDDAHDLPVPGRHYSFGTVKQAQARGDLAVLTERGRRALRVHVGADVEAGLKVLDAAIAQALS